MIICNRDGFDLALHGGRDVGPLPAFLHIGFRVDAADRVRNLSARWRADGVAVVEEHDEPTYVAFTCADPDGHRAETYGSRAADAAHGGIRDRARRYSAGGVLR